MTCLDDFRKITVGDAVVFHGSNLDVLPFLADNSIDAIVTDPPYELGFMGKKWDSSGIAYSVELWRECLRVLKPGGHLLSFGGTRTWHRVAVAIEDAGFDMRDSIAWMYGSGFPKSLDVSKAIDKGYGENSARQLQFTKWMRASGLTATKARDVLFDAGLITEKSNQASHYFAETTGSQPAIATADMFDALRPYLPEVPEEIERLVAERTGIEWTAYKNREVIGNRTGAQAESTGRYGSWGNDDGTGKSQFDITAPATAEAKQWQGWGTALKPAFEPIVVARKPITGTVAENVLEWGVGGLNIDGSRIGTETVGWQGAGRSAETATAGASVGGEQGGYNYSDGDARPVQGRWPANVILDEYTAGILDEQSGVRPGATSNSRSGVLGVFPNGLGSAEKTAGYGDNGGASRFFYVAKASKRDRNEGLDNLEGKEIGAKGNGLARTCSTCGASVLDGCECPDRTFVNPERKNFHPTVKPTDLMRYLIKLVTPAGGTVLDPFTGSGSTGKAALLDGFKFVGIEMTEDYLPIIEGRLRFASEQARQATVEAEAKEKETLF